jgi:uncharacterized protein (TIGR03000 family)
MLRNVLSVSLVLTLAATAARPRPQAGAHLGVGSHGAATPEAIALWTRLNSFSAYPTSYGGYSLYGIPSDYSSLYQRPRGRGDSSSRSPGAAAQASQMPGGPTADHIEASGPLDTPPPLRAIVRLRLPHTGADVAFDGRKVDSMGRARTYVTPELSGARTFEVTATWKNKGRVIWVLEEVTVEEGQIRTLDFTSGY